MRDAAWTNLAVTRQGYLPGWVLLAINNTPSKSCPSYLKIAQHSTLHNLYTITFLVANCQWRHPDNTLGTLRQILQKGARNNYDIDENNSGMHLWPSWFICFVPLFPAIWRVDTRQANSIFWRNISPFLTRGLSIIMCSFFMYSLLNTFI